MKRRNFLKLVGVTVVCPSLPKDTLVDKMRKAFKQTKFKASLKGRSITVTVYDEYVATLEDAAYFRGRGDESFGIPYWIVDRSKL